MKGKRYWLVGASEGLGREVARRMHGEGAELVLSARNGARLEELSNELPGSEIAPVDVTDADAVQKVASRIGHVDGVIYNAGAYEPLSAQDWDTQAVLSMSDVNYVGALRVIGETLPGFLEAGSGEITLVGSLAGYRGLPKAVGYGASKAALISLAETLRHDLAGTGVTVRIVNPGFIRTRLTDKNTFSMPMLMEPGDAADRVLRAMKSRKFRTDFPAPFSWALKALDCLPDLLVYRGR